MTLDFISPLVSTIGGYFNKKQEINKIVKEGEIELAKVKAQTDIEIAKARIQAIQNGQQMDGDLDRIAMEQMNKSWKDEFILIIFMTPVIMAFIPQLSEYALEGFKVVDQMPDWYKVVVISLVIVIYGLRRMATKWIEDKKKIV